jgi:hypothetical protein
MREEVRNGNFAPGGEPREKEQSTEHRSGAGTQEADAKPQPAGDERNPTQGRYRA